MKKISIRILILMLLLFQFFRSNAQKHDSILTKTSETINRHNFTYDLTESGSFLYSVGRINNYILYEHKHEWKKINFYILKENSYRFEQVFKNFKLDAEHLYSFTIRDSSMFYVKTTFNTKEMEDDGYSELMFWYDDKVIRLDSIYYADKNIRASFSTDGKYLLVNTLSELPDYYQPEIDDQIMVYSIDSLKKGRVDMQSISCKLCADSYLVGDQLFFTKSNVPDDLWGGYAWPDIYVAPWGRIQDSVKIAAAADIYAISPDGNILTKRKDLPNGPRAIIDVATKKYQLLLGREYQKAQAFYSYQKEKFAFDFGDRIVYVDFPKEYPFDALNPDNPEVPFDLDLKPFQHPPFDK